MAVKPIPEGYHSVTPYLSVRGAAKAIDFYKQAFGAEEIMRIGAPGGTVGHAEIRIGDSVVMLTDEAPDMGMPSPEQLGGSPVSILIYVDDVDAVFERAVAAGASVEQAVEDRFYGDRAGSVRDPFGHGWYIHTNIEDVPPDEMEKRVKAAADGA